MIAKLKGVVDTINEDSLIIDVGGVGYSVFVTSRFLSDVHKGDKVDVLTYHIFRQDQQYLCGFQSNSEIALFKNLLDVPGIGVKSALAVLSILSPEKLAIAIATQDTDALLKVGGIGKKSAARILLELKGKSSLQLKDSPVLNLNSDNVNDAILGLVSLGYQRSYVLEKVSKIVNEVGRDVSTNEIILQCLKELR